MNNQEYLEKLLSICDAYIDDAEAEFNARWELWEKKLSQNEIYEVVGGLLARQTIIAINMANAVSAWNPHVAPLIHRAMADAYITLAWILEDPLSRSQRYIQYGLGQQKLHIEHRKKQAERDGKDPKNDPVTEALEGWCNEQRYTFLTEVDVGSWSGMTTRQMAEEAGCIDFYNYVYQPFSSAVHSTWAHVGLHNMRECQNPLHRYHRIPSLNHIGSDAYDLFLAAKYLNKSFRLFDKKMAVETPTKSAFDTLDEAMIDLHKNDRQEQSS